MRDFKKLIVRDDNGCEYCFGEREYEMMTLGHDGEPRYYMQACICTIEGEPTVNIIRIRPSGALEVVGGQMNTILAGLRI